MHKAIEKLCQDEGLTREVRLYLSMNEYLGYMSRDYFLIVGMEGYGYWIDESKSCFMVTSAPSMKHAKIMHSVAVSNGCAKKYKKQRTTISALHTQLQSDQE